MAALGPRKRAFVAAMFMPGVNNATEAARAAGYQATGHAMSVEGHRLIHDPKIQAAMFEYSRSRLQARSPVLFRALEEMADAPGAKRLDAVKLSLALIGHNPVVEVHQRHEVVISYDEKLAELARLARLAGEDPERAVAGLAPPATVTDAEYEEVADGE
jgi:phage terminase small subunit